MAKAKGLTVGKQTFGKRKCGRRCNRLSGWFSRNISNYNNYGSRGSLKASKGSY